MYTLFWLSEPQTDRPAGRVDTTPPYRLSRCRPPASPFLSCLGEVVCFCVPAVYRYFLRRRRRRQGGILRFLSPPSIPRNSSLSLTNHHQTSHPRCNTQSTPGMWVVRWTLPTPHSLWGGGGVFDLGRFHRRRHYRHQPPPASLSTPLLVAGIERYLKVLSACYTDWLPAGSTVVVVGGLICWSN